MNDNLDAKDWNEEFSALSNVGVRQHYLIGN